MPISVADVRHIARLARLELSDSEVERFQTELTTILNYVAQLDSLAAEVPSEPSAADQPLRPDLVEPWPDVRFLHAEAPDFVDGHYRVPRTVE